jgi:hypothetical protein
MVNEPSPPQTPSYSDFLGKLLFNLGNFAIGHLVNELIGISVSLEESVAICLAIYLARDDDRIDLLEADVIGYIPHDKKVNLLEKIMGKEGCTSEFPDLIATIRAIFRIRNQLAHSYQVKNEPGAEYQRSYHRRGEARRVSLDPEEMMELRRRAEVIGTQLVELAKRFRPDQ